MALVELAALVAGIALISYSSEKSVEYSTHIAHGFRVPPIIVGVVLVSIGTDIPEIANSIFSSYSGHGDINVGNALGSCLAQISLVLGATAILGGTVLGTRSNILLLGGAATASTAIAAFVVMDGVLGSDDALLLIASYLVIMAITARFTCREFGTKEIDISHLKNRMPVTFILLVVSLVGVVIGAVVIVENIIAISNGFGLPEYLISFFAIGLGTSLPELSVGIAAVKKRNYGMVLGNLMGSNIVDATLALGIGPLLFPTEISQGIVGPVALYVVFVSAATVGIFALRQKIDKKAGIVLIALYLLSYLFLV